MRVRQKRDKKNKAEERFETLVMRSVSRSTGGILSQLHFHYLPQSHDISCHSILQSSILISYYCITFILCYVVLCHIFTISYHIFGSCILSTFKISHVSISFVLFTFRAQVWGAIQNTLLLIINFIEIEFIYHKSNNF